MDIARAPEDPVRTGGDATDELRRVQLRERRRDGPAVAAPCDRGRAARGRGRAESLPAQRPVAKPDARGQEARGQLLPVRAGHGRGDRAGGGGRARALDLAIEDHGMRAVARAPDTQLPHGREWLGAGDDQAQRHPPSGERGRREGVVGDDAPDELLTVLSERRGVDADRLGSAGRGAGRDSGRREHANENRRPDHPRDSAPEHGRQCNHRRSPGAPVRALEVLRAHEPLTRRSPPTG